METADFDRTNPREVIAIERMQLARAMLARIREFAKQGIDRDVLTAIAEEMRTLAARADLFPADEFDPAGGAMYRLSQDADHRFALYVVAPTAGVSSPPHDHASWAVIAGIRGREHNRLYRRLDDGTEPGVARIEQSGELDIVAGSVLAMMTDDIHSIHLGADGPHASLHLYGLSPEHNPQRRMYSRSDNGCKTFPPASGVQKARGAD